MENRIRWFAWYPVRLWYGDWVWLEPVYRTRIFTAGKLRQYYSRRP